MSLLWFFVIDFAAEEDRVAVFVHAATPCVRSLPVKFLATSLGHAENDRLCVCHAPKVVFAIKKPEAP